jgi:hypothetical protein
MKMKNYIQIINNYGELYRKWENAFCGGRSKQPPAKMNFVPAGVLRNLQH